MRGEQVPLYLSCELVPITREGPRLNALVCRLMGLNPFESICKRSKKTFRISVINIHYNHAGGWRYRQYQISAVIRGLFSPDPLEDVGGISSPNSGYPKNVVLRIWEEPVSMLG